MEIELSRTKELRWTGPEQAHTGDWWQEMTGTNGSVTWRAFGSSKQLRLHYDGVVIAQNGSFLYCPSDTEHGLAAYTDSSHRCPFLSAI